LKPWLPLELYDLKGDIGETRNCARSNPGVVEDLEVRLRSIRTDSEIWEVPRWRRF